MASKIITHPASVVAQNKKDCVRVLGRGARSKSKRRSTPASLSGNFTNVPATCLERRLRTAQSNYTQGYVPHVIGNWNVLTFTGKEWELVKEAKIFHLDIVEVFSTMRSGFGIVYLNGKKKLFYSGADPNFFELKV